MVHLGFCLWGDSAIGQVKYLFLFPSVQGPSVLLLPIYLDKDVCMLSAMQIGMRRILTMVAVSSYR